MAERPASRGGPLERPGELFGGPRAVAARAGALESACFVHGCPGCATGLKSRLDLRQAATPGELACGTLHALLNEPANQRASSELLRRAPSGTCRASMWRWMAYCLTSCCSQPGPPCMTTRW